MIRTFTLACLLLMLAPMMANAQAAAPAFVAGDHYVLLETPVRTRDASKVEVVEVFWYGCSHCMHFEPLVNTWKKTMPKDVDFWTSPAMWNGPMKIHAKAFYAAQALGVEDKLRAPIFTSLVLERKRLNTEADLANLFADHGVDRAAFKKAFNSFGVNSQVTQADARARSYKVTGTPEVVVNGKYRVSAKLAGGQAEMLKVVDFLVEKERALIVSK